MDVRVSVFETPRFNRMRDWPPTSLVGFIDWFQQKLNAIPKQYRDLAWIDLRTDYEGVSWYVDFSIYYTRPETNIEIDERVKWEHKTRSSEANERREYERLSKEIILTQGQRAIVDDEDYEWLVSMGSWYALKRVSPSNGRFLGFYAARMDYSEGKKTVHMHNVIFGAKSVTHLNGKSLDNRRENLKKIDQRQTQGIRIKKEAGRSKYKGVRRYGRLTRWEARITNHGQQIIIGYYDTEVEAAKAYDDMARKFFGEFATVNFPLPGERYYGERK